MFDGEIVKKISLQKKFWVKIFQVDFVLDSLWDQQFSNSKIFFKGKIFSQFLHQT